MMDSLFTKCRVFFIVGRRRRCYLFSSFVYDPLNMLLLNSFTWNTKRPAVSSWNLFVKLPWLCLVRVRTWEVPMFFACVVILKALLMRSKTIWWWVVKTDSLSKITWLVKRRPTSIHCVWLNTWEAWIFSETIGCLWWGIRQGHQQ